MKSATPPRICVLGSINQDLVIYTPRFPNPGETLLGGPFESFPGGKGANQAVAAARLGANVDFLGCVGDDDGGHMMREVFAEAGVNADAVKTCPHHHTGVGVITVSPEGENHIVVASGANMEMDAAWVDEHAHTIRAADALLLQLEISLEANQRAVQIANDANVPVILNAAPAHSLPDEFLSGLHTLIVNQHEFEILGSPPVPRLIVTYGKEGAVCIDTMPDGTVKKTCQASYPVNPVDTTAAGDAFCAAAAVASLQSPVASEFLSWGTAAGALACTIVGAIPALPSLEQVTALRASGDKSQSTKDGSESVGKLL
ncbi:MAG: ribokinase [Planctomycetes bacterium]|nr:ribokinase [Planctomycetota bacterium]